MTAEPLFLLAGRYVETNLYSAQAYFGRHSTIIGGRDAFVKHLKEKNSFVGNLQARILTFLNGHCDFSRRIAHIASLASRCLQCYGAYIIQMRAVVAVSLSSPLAPLAVSAICITPIVTKLIESVTQGRGEYLRTLENETMEHIEYVEKIVQHLENIDTIILKLMRSATIVALAAMTYTTRLIAYGIGSLVVAIQERYAYPSSYSIAYAHIKREDYLNIFEGHFETFKSITSVATLYRESQARKQRLAYYISDGLSPTTRGEKLLQEYHQEIIKKGPEEIKKVDFTKNFSWKEKFSALDLCEGMLYGIEQQLLLKQQKKSDHQFTLDDLRKEYKEEMEVLEEFIKKLNDKFTPPAQIYYDLFKINMGKHLSNQLKIDRTQALDSYITLLNSLDPFKRYGVTSEILQMCEKHADKTAFSPEMFNASYKNLERLFPQYFSPDHNKINEINELFTKYKQHEKLA